ncbi:expressed unknown protein [Seminavis robusta]|uniref:Circumsporozoite protein n=1 Tax=Seminavis robusta TaxID=568900 RepID=A0A9N8EPB1_9STRA|nr:expressed unknown protein [Seminavis robusta]|eukprot:Sro1583_g284000.1 n/a (536) ;mRNA; f:21778-23385
MTNLRCRPLSWNHLLISTLCLWSSEIIVRAQAEGPPTAYFFGDNSLSIFDLPRHFQASYHRAAGNKINVERHSPIGATLSTHVNYMLTDPSAPDFHDGNNYRWMILQEHGDIPALPTWRANSTVAAQTLHSYAEDALVVRTMFLMTWGRRNGFVGNGVEYADFISHNQAMLEGYLQYISATSTPASPTFVAPVGLVFETIYNDCLNANIDPLSDDCLFSRLFSGDTNYPSMQGTYVAGLTVATAITGYDPLRQMWLPDIDDYDFDPDDAFVIRHAVSRTILETFYSGLIQYPWYEAWPTAAPTSSPTKHPTTAPSESPSDMPSLWPSDAPSDVPSMVPSDVPSSVPSDQPSMVPSSQPSSVPSLSPSTQPSDIPSSVPSDAPSDVPSMVPTLYPSAPPSLAPTGEPSAMPSDAPSDVPSMVPSDQPSSVPTVAPTSKTGMPSASPTGAPTAPMPSAAPSAWVLELHVDNDSDVSRNSDSDMPPPMFDPRNSGAGEEGSTTGGSEEENATSGCRHPSSLLAAAVAASIMLLQIIVQ